MRNGLVEAIVGVLLVLGECGDNGQESSCTPETDGRAGCREKEPEESLTLFRWDPVEVGYRRELDLEIGKKHVMVTKSVRPPVFVVEEYMEDYECDYIIEKARNEGLFTSELHLDSKTLLAKNYSNDNLKAIASNFDWIDLNQNGVIDVPGEIQTMAYNIKLLYLTELEVDEILHKFNGIVTTLNGHKMITRENYRHLDVVGVQEYMKDLRELHPHHRDRFSEQVWLNVHTKDSMLDKLMRRLSKLTRLDERILYGTEPIQVVHYRPHGHYHAHFDSQDRAAFPESPCCHTVVHATAQSCRLCRYLTALVFLNTVARGGETAFPVADEAGYTQEEYLKRKHGDLYNLSRFCRNASLVVEPRKGTMVLWYNHLVSSGGLLGPLDPFSLHGGCDVLEGEKWIANNWIPAPDVLYSGYRSVYRPGAGGGGAAADL